MEANNDYVQWLRQYGERIAASAEKAADAGDEAKAEKLRGNAGKFLAASEALRQAQEAVNTGAAAGNYAVNKALAPGKSVIIRLIGGEKVAGVIEKMGRYDLIFRVGATQLVIPKHSVVFYELLDGEGEGS